MLMIMDQAEHDRICNRFQKRVFSKYIRLSETLLLSGLLSDEVEEQDTLTWKVLKPHLNLPNRFRLCITQNSQCTEFFFLFQLIEFNEFQNIAVTILREFSLYWT